jgi:glycosyltransferase involved in cell wall biosynthesis
MVYVKGLDVLLTAASLLRGRIKRFRLYLLGDGVERRTLESLAARGGLDEFVRFVGYVDHSALPLWFRAANVVVLPSRSEGIPNVLLESIACGTPFVASDVGGIAEIADKRLDRLVRPDDPQALASAIAAALSDSQMAIRRWLPPSVEDAADQLGATLQSLTLSGRSKNAV